MTSLPHPSQLLPHGDAFRFVDEIVSIEDDRIVARRKVPLSEPWTDAHFPGDPVVPGVLLLEGMIQTCGLLLRLRASEEGLQGRLAAVRAARFKLPVLPGATIIYVAERKLSAGELSVFTVQARVDDREAAQAEVTLSLRKAS